MLDLLYQYVSDRTRDPPDRPNAEPCGMLKFQKTYLSSHIPGRQPDTEFVERDRPNCVLEAWQRLADRAVPVGQHAPQYDVSMSEQMSEWYLLVPTCSRTAQHGRLLRCTNASMRVGEI